MIAKNGYDNNGIYMHHFEKTLSGIKIYVVDNIFQVEKKVLYSH